MDRVALQSPLNNRVSCRILSDKDLWAFWEVILRLLFRIAVLMSGMNMHAVALPGSISNLQCGPRNRYYLQRESN